MRNIPPLLSSPLGPRAPSRAAEAIFSSGPCMISGAGPCQPRSRTDASLHMQNLFTIKTIFSNFTCPMQKSRTWPSTSSQHLTSFSKQLLKIGQLNAQNPAACYTEKPLHHPHFVMTCHSSAVCGEIPVFGRPPNHGIGPWIHSSLPPFEPLNRSGLGDANPHKALV